jgi:hypothetical protein
VAAKIAGDALSVELDDGRTVTVPIGWYPRLAHASSRERRNWRLIGAGEGIHWPDLDEDVSVEGILAGRRSAESQSSFARWLASREPGAGKGMQPTRARAAKPSA